MGEYITMHEVALMSSILDTLRDSAIQNNIQKINNIKLIVGKFSMALPDSLSFAFEALGQEELFKEAVLEIEERDIECLCNDCNQAFNVDNSYYLVCPYCESHNVQIISGRELFIDYYEGD